MLPFIVIGLVAGSVYALGGVGLVLTYKTSRIFNFAYGAIATTGAYVFYFLHVQHGLNWPLSAFISVVAVGTVLGFVFEPFARVLARAPLAMQIGATVGILVFVQGLFAVLYGDNVLVFPPFLPQSEFTVGGAFVSYAELITVLFTLIATLALYAVFRFARIGVAMRGVVDNPELLDLAGTPPARIRRIAWIIGCCFAAATGLLLAPGLQLDSSTLTLLMLECYGAAAIGAFSSLPATYVGGLVIGLAYSLLTKYTLTSSSILQGLPASVPFVVLFIVLLVMPRRRLAVPFRITAQRPQWHAPIRVQAVAGIITIAAACFVPSLVGFKLLDWTEALAYVVLFLSLGILVRTSGQVSLGQLSFAAVGAAAFSHLTVGAGIPWLPALILAGLITVPVGLVFAIPAIRLGGIYLALATFGFALVLQNMFYSSTSLMFGTSGISMPRPHLSWLDLSSDKGFFYVVLAATAVVTILLVAIDRTRLGRLLRGLSDSPLALATNGTDTNVTRMLVFAISAFLAGIAGAFIGINTQLVDGSVFDPLSSLTMITLILIVVGGAPWYAIMAAASFIVIPAYIPGGNVTYYLQMLFGASAVLVAINGMPPTPLWLRQVADRLGGVKQPARSGAVPGPVAAGHERTASAEQVQLAQRTVEPGELVVEDITVRFGGLVAVNNFSLRAATGRITGLIGPNGAGKTTTFNACSGIVRPTAGKVLLDGRDVTRCSISRRARLGLGRTFQQMELFDGLSVAENVAIGGEAALAGANPIRQLISRRSEHGAVREAVADALALCGIEDLAEQLAGSLSTGQRRLVELARCLAGSYRILLLDEPSSGLDHHESDEFGRILERVVAERGVGILLVEHDMSLVMGICEYIHVLDFGVPIFEGSPAEVLESTVVQHAYLGEPDAALAESTE